MYLAHGAAYPFRRTVRKLTGWQAHPDCEVYVAGTVPGRTGYMGVIPALPIYVMHISDGGAGPRNQIVWTCGNHPSETPDRWNLEGAIDWLLGESAAAALVRQWCDLYVYPQVNPQGCYGGYWRSSPEAAASDHNRLWQTTTTIQSVTITRNSILGLTGGVIHGHVDWHARPGSVGGNWQVTEIYGSPVMAEGSAAYLDAVGAYHTIVQTWPDPTAGTVRSWVAEVAAGHQVIGATTEEAMGSTRTLAHYRSLGEAMGKGLADVIAAGGVLPYGPA